MSYLQSERKPNQSAFNQHPDTFNMQFGVYDFFVWHARCKLLFYKYSLYLSIEELAIDFDDFVSSN